ncbi:MAG TPA: hypothetical protein VHL98_17470 [Microvirga sp.]|jgi:hypothetical protein|nr:hypothetical protein [Microvirga sp.]
MRLPSPTRAAAAVLAFRRPAAAAAFLLAAALPAAALEGQYRVQGTNPGGGGAYAGTVTVQRTGQTYQVVWQIQGARYVGTGIGGPEGLAVTYRSGNDTGVAIYIPAAQGGFDGVWTYAGGRQVGEERWSQR